MTQIEKHLCFSLPRPDQFTDPAVKPSPLTAVVGAFLKLGKCGSDMETKAGDSDGLLQQLTCQAKKCLGNVAWAFCKSLSNAEIRR